MGLERTREVPLCQIRRSSWSSNEVDCTQLGYDVYCTARELPACPTCRVLILKPGMDLKTR